LKKIRKEIAFFYEDLEEIVTNKNFKSAFNNITIEEGQVLKTAPKGYDPNHPAIEFLKLKSFTVSQKIDDNIFTDKDFSKKIAEQLILIKPFNNFLTRALETEE